MLLHKAKEELSVPKKNNLIPPSTPGQPGALLLQVMDTSSRVALMAALEDSAGKKGFCHPSSKQQFG